MQLVNQLPMQRITSVNRIPLNNSAINKQKMIEENYHFNQQLLDNKLFLNPDSLSYIMNYLDHRANIQFIRISKHLYEYYAAKDPDGRVRYKDCLFTPHPFDFDCYTRALFHYAPQYEDQANILLSIQDVGNCRLEMLKEFGIETSDTTAVMNFYKQSFSDYQFKALAIDPEFLKAMLKRGISPNVKSLDGKFIYDVMYRGKAKEILKVLLDDPRMDLNEQDKDGNSILIKFVQRDEVEIVKLLLADKRTNPDIQNIFGNTAFMLAILKNRPELVKILLCNSRVNSK